MEADKLVTTITETIIKRLQLDPQAATLPEVPPVRCPQPAVPVGVSNRHIHLTAKDARTLFGTERLTVYKELSQPGQYACQEKVTMVGPSGVIENVRVLGPARQTTQVEISVSDGLKLGVNAPVRESGNLKGSAGVTLVGPAGAACLTEGVIIAARHLHLHTDDARRLRIRDGEVVSARIPGPRGLILNEVIARVGDRYALELHVDIDEANAAGLKNGDCAEIIKNP